MNQENFNMTVLKSRKRNGVTQYFVVFDDQDENSPKKGQWLKDNNPKFKPFLDQYEESHKEKKKTTRKTSTVPPRRIQKILGIMDNDNEKVFIVKFTDSENFEKVSHADMKNRYTKSLLAFYEQHIVLK